MSCLLESHTEDICDDRIIFNDQNMHGFFSHNYISTVLVRFPGVFTVAFFER